MDSGENIQNKTIPRSLSLPRYCATDKTKSLDILSRLRTLEILEKEMVPTCLRLYYNAKDSGAKSYLRTLRNFWKSEFDALEASILDIVDATALCAVIDEEVRTTASEIRKRTYAQVVISFKHWKRSTYLG